MSRSLLSGNHGYAEKPETFPSSLLTKESLNVHNKGKKLANITKVQFPTCILFLQPQHIFIVINLSCYESLETFKPPFFFQTMYNQKEEQKSVLQLND